MSKKSFSEKSINTMHEKIKSIEELNPNVFFKKDENFEIILCLAYMTLSKEEIIKKDIKNKNRLDRLTKMIEQSEIDKLFEHEFCEDIPVIINTKEQNKLWILDNIRDSIMHGVFDIDEAKKVIIINNTQYDRELEAIIPFSWFIKYAKNDILNKKIMDKYYVRGFYYDKTKKNRTLNTKKETINHILYNVKIVGDKFNVNEVENRIMELFDKYSDQEINDDIISKYKDIVDNKNIPYNKKYLISFYEASEKVKNEIKKEFPTLNVSIYIEGKKQKFINQALKKLPKFYTNYDLMIDDFNNLVYKKRRLLLKYLSNIIENIDLYSNIDYSNLNDYEIMNIYNSILNYNKTKYTKIEDITNKFKENKKILRSLCLNAYGLSTLVINHENLYNNYFLNQNPINYNIYAYSTKNYLDYMNKLKKLNSEFLDIEINLFKKQEQLNKCSNNNGKLVLNKNINSLLNQKQSIELEINNLKTTMNFEPIEKSDLIDYEKREKLTNVIETYYGHFYNANTIEAKKKIKSIIENLIDLKIEMDSKYTYGYCKDMKDILKMIRNCFSHLGRIYIGMDNGRYTYVVLNDYATDGKKAGEVITTYNDLINLLQIPYIESNAKVKKIN